MTGGISGLIGARGTQIDTRGSGLGGLSSPGGIGGEPIILGALDRSLIDGVIRDNLEPIRACYQDALAETPIFRAS
ncbi:MAG: hypothetical protein ACI8RZ_003735 [Myxococcota bacterium]